MPDEATNIRACKFAIARSERQMLGTPQDVISDFPDDVGCGTQILASRVHPPLEDHGYHLKLVTVGERSRHVKLQNLRLVSPILGIVWHRRGREQG